MGLISAVVAKAKKIHLNYSMVTSLYMMEPWEVTIINSFVILIFATMLYSSWVYLPHYTWKLLVFTGILSSRPGDNVFDGAGGDSIYNIDSTVHRGS